MGWDCYRETPNVLLSGRTNRADFQQDYSLGLVGLGKGTHALRAISAVIFLRANPMSMEEGIELPFGRRFRTTGFSLIMQV